MFSLKRVVAVLCCAVTIVQAAEFQLDKTVEDIPKKVLIIKHDAKLFESESSEKAEEAPFIQLYFLMTPEIENRVPVLKKFSRDQTQPDGWLEKDSYVEWNTVEMINFEPLTGREQVKIYATEECANNFGTFGETIPECEVLGEEPAQNTPTRLFVPIFKREADNYHGGFIRVYQDDKGNKSQLQNIKLGYDLILVVDSTLSMGEYFQPTLHILQSFIKVIQNTMQDEVITPFNIGLLFYRDRKNWQNCDIGYLTHWGQLLTSEPEKVMQALNTAKSTGCDSDEPAEAVFDGLHRAIIDTPWNSNHFKTILLIGDAPPNFEKNPMNFSVASINELADEKSIRFLTLKIGLKSDSDYKEFEDLALEREAHLKGRFRHIIKADLQQFEKDLMDALTTEWDIFKKTLASSKEPVTYLSQMTEYELPIIVGQLDQMNQDEREFIKGWVPRKVKGQLAFGEHLFMRKVELKFRISIFESIIAAAEFGMLDGGEAFISAVRQTLAALLKMKTDDILLPHETLGDILLKSNILPFKTGLLLFTPEDLNTWKPQDYEKLNQSLTEKLRYLREFLDNPNNIHLFEGVAYLYVPKGYFP